MKKIVLIIFLAMLFFSCSDEQEVLRESTNSSISAETHTLRLRTIKQVTETRGVAVTDKKWKPGDVIRIKFLNGDSFLQTKVKDIAKTWLTENVNLTFEYVDSGDADVKIGFDVDNVISWSTIGTDCKAIAQEKASANFVDLNGIIGNEAAFRSEVLRMYGHILGLGFEHKHPQSPIKFKGNAANYFVFMCDLSQEYVEKELLPIYNMSHTNYEDMTAYDPSSIMVLDLPRTILENPRWAIPANTELSTLDIELIEDIYPFPCTGRWSNLREVSTNGRIEKTSLSIGSFRVSCMGADNKAYFASKWHGIWKLEDDGSFTQVNSQALRVVNYMVLGPDNQIYIGTLNGIFRMNSDYTLTNLYERSNSENYAWKDNKLYFATDFYGIHKLDTDGTVTYHCPAARTNCGGIWIGVGQNGLFYSGTIVDASKDGIWCTKADNTVTQVVPKGLATFWNPLMGADNKLYFCSRESYGNNGGMWRLEDNGTIVQTECNRGQYFGGITDSYGFTYFFGNGNLHRLENGKLVLYLYYNHIYNAINKDNKTYLVNREFFAEPEKEFGEYGDLKRYNILNPENISGGSEPQLGQNGYIYIYGGEDCGIQRYNIDNHQKRAWTLKAYGKTYHLSTYASSLGINNIERLFDDEFDKLTKNFIEYLKTENSCPDFKVLNSYYE